MRYMRQGIRYVSKDSIETYNGESGPESPDTRSSEIYDESVLSFCHHHFGSIAKEKSFIACIGNRKSIF